jgi:hypothetical protein
MLRAHLLPKSKKAEQILRQKMLGITRVDVKTREGNRLLLVSLKGDFCIWVNLKDSNDWNLVFRNQ